MVNEFIKDSAVNNKLTHTEMVGTRNIQEIFRKFPHFYIFGGNGEGRSSSNWLSESVM